MAEVVGDAGLSFRTGDEEGLAGCLEQALESPGFVNTRKELARKRAIKLFPERRMIEEHLALYRRLLVRGGPVC